MMDFLYLLGQLFFTFFIIGMFTFGGGYAMLSLIQGQVVTAHGWITNSQFTDIVAISQMTPGPVGINCATYAGYDAASNLAVSIGVENQVLVQALGTAGSLVATLALVMPSFLIVLAIAKFYMRFSHSTLFEGTMAWLRPAVSGLIGAAAAIMVISVSWAGVPLFSQCMASVVEENFPHGDWVSWCLFGAAFFVSMKFKVSPILIILGGGLLGLLIYWPF